MAAQPKPFPKMKPIHVYPDGHAENDPEHLSKRNKEEALFSTKRSMQDVEVVFDIDGTPFDSDKFPVPKGTETQSGPVRGDVKPPRAYHYHVRPHQGRWLERGPHDHR